MRISYGLQNGLVNTHIKRKEMARGFPLIWLHIRYTGFKLYYILIGLFKYERENSVCSEVVQKIIGQK